LAQRANNLGPSTTATLSILDDEADLTVSLSQSTLSEAKGANAATITVSRSLAASQAPDNLAITVSASDTSEAITPAVLILKSGQRSGTLPLATANDGIVDGSQQVLIVAVAAGFSDGAAALTVTDDDTPTLQLALNATTISESGPRPAATGTISRNTSLDVPLQIALRSSEPAQVGVPNFVTIPRDAVSVDFPIYAVDDTRRDGRQTVTIFASRAGFPTVSTPLAVADNEGPSLRVDFAAPNVSEGLATVSGTITRLGASTASPLTVTLATSDKTIAAPNSTIVIIPAGASKVGFTLSTLANTVPEDVRYATITASASGFNEGAATLKVLDDNDAAVLSIAVKSNALPGTVDAFPHQPNDVDPRPLGNPPAANEDAGPQAFTATISRNTALTSELVVFVTIGGDITAPKVVVIPAGVRSVSFDIGTIDDELKCLEDSNTLATVAIAVAGFTSPPPAPLIVVDNDSEAQCVVLRTLKVTVTSTVQRTPAAIAETDGARAARIEVKRSDDDAGSLLPLVVDLISSDPTLAKPVVGRVILPARRSLNDYVQDKDDKRGYYGFTYVNLAAFDNKIFDGCLPNVTITPRAVGFLKNPSRPDQITSINEVEDRLSYDVVSDDVQILDNSPQIQLLSATPLVINEGGSAGVATGLVRRLPGTTGALTVSIRSATPREIGVSPTGRNSPVATLDVVIPDGQDVASFDIIANDDNIADGDQTAFLEATTTCSSSVQRLSLRVRDNDVPTLTLRLASTVTSEKGLPVRATITRNSTDTRPLVIALRSSDTSELSVPLTVTLPAGLNQSV